MGERFTPTHVGNTPGPSSPAAAAAVHPHARGEYRSPASSTRSSNGSPPRTWGIRAVRRPALPARRFTPTHVGNTWASSSAAPGTSVHPHARGEYGFGYLRLHPPCGSPPRTWGIRRPACPFSHKKRFTPTHVGNTRDREAQQHLRPVHPHARGEYFQGIIGGPPCQSGSPPRTWGIRADEVRVGRRVRFTPTHVGNTCSTRPASRKATVHPHARGEYPRPTPTSPACGGSPPRTWGIRENPRNRSKSVGSPPRTWGIRPRRVVEAAAARFTPTHVGNTRSSPSSGTPCTVHPHARGEYGEERVTGSLLIGSPPRTWGIQARRGKGGARRRFTPTHVGNTFACSYRKRSRPVHPHARGEYGLLACGGAASYGSPPRTWGIRPVGAPNPVRHTVHPHARGEYFRPAVQCIISPGSPPRTWGIPEPALALLPVDRFTPTHVGNTTARTPPDRLGVGSPPRTWGIRLGHGITPRAIAVHPHARGEYQPLVSNSLKNVGSPPRTWGIRFAGLGADASDRFTPTHVGNTSASGGFGRLLRFTPTHVGNTQAVDPNWNEPTVHPHARGEYATAGDGIGHCVGSPPRTWGIRPSSLRFMAQARFTPTHVGNTCSPWKAASSSPVHPHARGEYGTSGFTASSTTGSPPRTWGILLALASPPEQRRFTPTHVGNTNHLEDKNVSRTVHPHARGEYERLSRRCDFRDGSPPRTWGIRLVSLVGVAHGRFTPTHVGNTSAATNGNLARTVHPHARGEYFPE